MFNTLTSYLCELVEKDQFSGVVRITQGDQELYAVAFGYASRSWKVPNTLDIRFDTASITKVFTAVATLQLIERRLLSFDTSVTESFYARCATGEAAFASDDAKLFHAANFSQ